MENFSSLYNIFNQNFEQSYEKENYLPASSSFTELNFQNEENDPNFGLNFSSLLSSADVQNFHEEQRMPFLEVSRQQHNNNNATEASLPPQFVDETRFPVVPQEEIHEIREAGSSTNTARTTKTWMAVWRNWCRARNTNSNMETYHPVALDNLLTKFYAEIRKQDGTDYEPESLRVMQASLDRYLKQNNYPVSITTGREFYQSQQTLECKAKQLRRQGKGKRPNKAQPYNETEEEQFWSHGTLGNHNGTALTNVNFKNLTEIMGMRGRQDHYDAYVEDFTISCQADGSKVVEFKENPTKTRQGGLRNPTRHSPQQMWSTDGGERDPVRLFEEWLGHRPEALKTSGPLYLTIIPRPATAVWYAKVRMGEHRIGQIMKSVASCLPPEYKKKITNHSARKTVVAKLKKAGQPRHKIIQVTGHARESSLDAYDEVTEDERRQLSHIVSGHTKSSASTTDAVSSSAPNTSQVCIPQMPQVFSANQNVQPIQVYNNCVFNNNSSESSTATEKPRPKRRRAIIDSDSE